jgi:hypothetical protein
MRMEWVAYKACLEDRLPVNSVINDEESIDRCIDDLFSAIQKALAASGPKRLPRAKPRPSLLTGI